MYEARSEIVPELERRRANRSFDLSFSSRPVPITTFRIPAILPPSRDTERIYPKGGGERQELTGLRRRSHCGSLLPKSHGAGAPCQKTYPSSHPCRDHRCVGCRGTLDAREHMLARLAALVAIDAPAASYVLNLEPSAEVDLTVQVTRPPDSDSPNNRVRHETFSRWKDHRRSRLHHRCRHRRRRARS